MLVNTYIIFQILTVNIFSLIQILFNKQLLPINLQKVFKGQVKAHFSKIKIIPPS